jgi:hypothetical protein
MAAASKAAERQRLEGSNPSPSAYDVRGSANGRPAAFEAAYEGSTPSPRAWLMYLWCSGLHTTLKTSRCRFDSYRVHWLAIRKGKPTGDGNRVLSGRAATPCRFNSCPFRWFVKDVLLGEQRDSNPRAEGSTPSVLAFVPVAERPRHRLARPDRRVRLPPGTLSSPEGPRRPAALIRRSVWVRLPPGGL